jgi:hypothetical protein
MSEATQIPQYKLTERAYLGDVLYEEGAVIEFETQPSHYMAPLNDAAKAMVKKFPSQFHDPILALTKIN